MLQPSAESLNSAASVPTTRRSPNVTASRSSLKTSNTRSTVASGGPAAEFAPPAGPRGASRRAANPTGSDARAPSEGERRMRTTGGVTDRLQADRSPDSKESRNSRSEPTGSPVPNNSAVRVPSAESESKRTRAT